MNKARDIRNIALGAVVAVSGLSALAAVNLTSFAPGTPIKSNEVNANFSSLKANIEALQAPNSISGAQLAAGSVDKTKLATTGTVADGKVLKLSSGNLVWGDDIVGSPGTSYTADGSSLALSGTTFSVKDAGITGSKIAVPLSLSSSSAKVLSVSNSFNGVGIYGQSGSTELSVPITAGVMGYSLDNTGVYGYTRYGTGVFGGSNDTGIGVKGQAVNGVAVDGYSSGSTGVFGHSQNGDGVRGFSTFRYGVYGESGRDNAVYGVATGTNAAIAGTSPSGYGAYFEAGSARCYFKAGTTGWDCASDRKLKENFKPVNTTQVLEAVAGMPVTTWSMKGSKIRQLGPTAQDFYAAFKLGDNDTTINATNAQGVALAAIKGMYEKNRALEHQVKTLEARLAALEKAVHSR